MEAVLSKRVDELVNCGWEPLTTTDTTAALVGRRPFAWWLFLILIFLFPLFGGLLYLIFWVATSRATVFLHVDDNEVVISGDQWLIKRQELEREAYVERQRQIKEQGFLPAMWPHLLVSLLMIAAYVMFLKWYFWGSIPTAGWWFVRLDEATTVLQAREMRKGRMIGILVISIVFLLYMSSPFILFPIALAGMSGGAGSGQGDSNMFDVISAPLVKVMEGNNVYYHAWLKYSESVCKKYEGRCPDMQNGASPSRNAVEQ